MKQQLTLVRNLLLHDWELNVDLDRKLLFPKNFDKNLRPDAVLMSQKSKMLVAMELTVWKCFIEADHYALTEDVALFAPDNRTPSNSLVRLHFMLCHHTGTCNTVDNFTRGMLCCVLF